MMRLIIFLLLSTCVLYGQPVGKTIKLASFDYDITNTKILQISKNRVLLMWRLKDNTLHGSTWQHQLYDENLTPVGTVYTYPKKIHLWDIFMFVQDDGTYIAFWNLETDELRTAWIYAQYFNADGNPAGEPVKVNSTFNSYRNRDEIFTTKLADGSILCSWLVDVPAGRYGRILSADGQRIGDEFLMFHSDDGAMFSLVWMTQAENGHIALFSKWGIYYLWSLETKKTVEKNYALDWSNFWYALPLDSKEFLLVGEDSQTDLGKGQIWNKKLEPLGEIIRFKSTYHNTLRVEMCTDKTLITSESIWKNDNIYYEFQKYSNRGVKLDGYSTVPGSSSSYWSLNELSTEHVLLTYSLPMHANVNAHRINKTTLAPGPLFTIQPFARNVMAYPLENGNFYLIWCNQNILWVKQFPAKELVHELKAFNLLSPAHDETVNTTNPVLVWQSAIDGEFAYSYEVIYNIYLDTNPNFTSPLFYKIDGDTTFTALDLQPGKTYFWRVRAWNQAGDDVWSDTKAFYITPTADVRKEQNEILPEQFMLSPNYPNPFNAYTVVPFYLPHSAVVNFYVHDINGRLVFSDSEFLTSGEQTKRIELLDLSSGLYFLTVSDGQIAQYQKLIMIK